MWRQHRPRSHRSAPPPSGAPGDRRVRRSDRLRRARGMAGLRARLDAGAPLVGAWLCHRGARAALGYSFTELGKERIVSLIHPENRASIRVAERIGERLEGRVPHLGREMLCFGIGRAEERHASSAGLSSTPGIAARFPANRRFRESRRLSSSASTQSFTPLAAMWNGAILRS